MLIYINPEKLRKVLTSVINSPYSSFYRDTCAKHGTLEYIQRLLEHPERMSDTDASEVLEQLPFLRRSDVTASHPDTRLYIEPKEIEFISYTSGTSDGKPVILYWSHVDDYFFDPSLGFDVQKPLILHPALNKNFGHTFIAQCRTSPRKLSPVFADYQHLAQSALLASSTSIDCIYTTPTLAEHLHTHLAPLYDTSKVKLIVVFSETLTSTKREILSSMYPSAVIANVYASSEVGQILMHPTHEELLSKKEVMHVITDAVIAVELIDNELVITMDQNKAFPLIRYKTGDFFYGEQGVNTLTWKGRDSIDILKVNGLEIRIEDIERALKGCISSIGTEYQFHIYSKIFKDTQKEQIYIEIETTIKHPTEFAYTEAKESIQQTLLHSWFLTSTATLKDAVQKGLVQIPHITFVDELSVRGVKTKRIVSHLS